MKIMKNIKKNTFIILIITILVMYFVLKDDFMNIIHALVNVDIKYLILAFLIFCFSIFLKGYISYKTVDDKKKYSLLEAIKHNVIVQFFNGITPFSTGGQPMEVYMLTEHNINANKGTMIILQNFIFYQIALVLFGIGAVVYNGIYGIFPKVPLLRELVLIGFIVNTLVAVGILFISISKKFTRFCVKGIIFILSKLRLVKNKGKVKENWRNILEEFHECAKFLRKRKRLFVIGILFNVLSLACLYIIPLFILYSIHDYTSLNVATTLTASAYVLLMGAFVPIPGASGGIEYGFLAFFGNFLSNTTTGAILLIWRFITYYLPMIVGAIIFNFDEKGDK